MSERSEAKRDGAKQQKNSGRGNYQKGDAQWRTFVVDYKEYEKTISVSQTMWSKICTDTSRCEAAMADSCEMNSMLPVRGNTPRTRMRTKSESSP